MLQVTSELVKEPPAKSLFVGQTDAELLQAVDGVAEPLCAG
jgi:hypothetical protein